MSGGGGDDTYFVDNIKDRVSERALGGNDIVYSSVSFKLAKAVDTLILTGSDNLSGTGSSDTNTLNGNSGDNLLDGFKGDDILRGFGGNDTLIGGIGSDTLEGGSGADAFFFKASPKALDGFDTILDFSRAAGDTIALAKGGFRGLGSVLGSISPDQFQAGAGVDTASDSTDRILYNTSTGNLWYDADGLGTLGPVLIAQLGVGSHPTLSHTDIILIA
jgi:Ca2+-binding RTX toxin-like protein